MKNALFILIATLLALTSTMASAQQFPRALSADVLIFMQQAQEKRMASTPFTQISTDENYTFYQATIGSEGERWCMDVIARSNVEDTYLHDDLRLVRAGVYTATFGKMTLQAARVGSNAPSGDELYCTITTYDEKGRVSREGSGFERLSNAMRRVYIMD